MGSKGSKVVKCPAGCAPIPGQQAQVRCPPGCAPLPAAARAPAPAPAQPMQQLPLPMPQFQPCPPPPPQLPLSPPAQVIVYRPSSVRPSARANPCPPGCVPAKASKSYSGSSRRSSGQKS